jgi:hypothetical protein
MKTFENAMSFPSPSLASLRSSGRNRVAVCWTPVKRRLRT